MTNLKFQRTHLSRVPCVTFRLFFICFIFIHFISRFPVYWIADLPLPCSEETGQTSEVLSLLKTFLGKLAASKPIQQDQALNVVYVTNKVEHKFPQLCGYTSGFGSITEQNRRVRVIRLLSDSMYYITHPWSYLITERT